MKSKTGYLFPYSHTPVVMGARRSAIYDLQSGTFHLVPNAMAELMIQMRTVPIEELTRIYGQENERYILEYIDYLQSHQLAYRSENALDFEELEPIWHSPWDVQLLVLEAEAGIPTWLSNNLSYIMAETLVLVTSQPVELAKTWGTTLAKLHYGNLEVAISSGRDQLNEVLGLLQNLPGIACVKVFGANTNHTEAIGGLEVMFLKGDWREGPAKVAPGNFNVSMENYLRSYESNLFYGNRLFVSAVGTVSIMPFTEPIIQLKEAKDLVQAAQKLAENWLAKSTKTKTDICMHCEFRHMCHDARLPRLDEETGFYTNDVPCNYDPFLATWSEAGFNKKSQ